MKILSNKNFIRSKFLGRVNDIKAVFSLSDIKLVTEVFRKNLRFIVMFSTGKTRVSARLRHFNKFLGLILKIHRDHGSLFVVKWLKASHTAIQRYISGVPYRSLREIEPDLPLPRLINGLPAFIGTMDRKSIRDGHPQTIRLWLSILSFYRVLEAPGKTKLDTIINPFGGDIQQLQYLSFHIDAHIQNLRSLTPILSMFKISALKVEALKISFKGGPNVSPAYRGVIPDAIALFRRPKIVDAIRDYCKIVSSESFFHLLERTNQVGRDWWRHTQLGEVIPSTKLYEFSHLSPKGRKIFDDVLGDISDLYSGRLHGIDEPAGKVRIIALVDIWTQSIFSPLHELLFTFLKTLPNDGTFDQDKAFFRAQAKASVSKVVYSVDLSSATDRLPIKIQVEILNSLFPRTHIGTIWGKILSRSFIVRDSIHDIKAGTLVSYGCGQPMGCLSSWAMLAVTHHFILQHCAFLAHGYQHWNTDYEILGDDLVIFDKKIYDEYIRLMVHLDVGTNPSKSLVSENLLETFEFAKRTSVRSTDVSGISWKQLISTRGLKDRINTILNLGVRDLITKPGLLIRLITWSDKSKIRNANDALTGLCFSLLYHFSEIGIVSFRDAIAYVVDPSKGEDQTFESLPVSTLLHDVLYLLKYKTSLLKGNPSSPDGRSLSKKDFRTMVVEGGVLPYLGNSLYRNTLGRVFEFEREYLLIPDKFKCELLASIDIFKDLTRVDYLKYPAYAELSSLIDDLAVSLLYRNGSPEDAFDIFGPHVYGLAKNPTISGALEFRDVVDNYIARYSFLKAVRKGKPIKELSLHWLAADLQMSTVVDRSSVYHRAMSVANRENNSIKVTKHPDNHFRTNFVTHI